MKDKITPILVAGLVIFAFLSGTLWNKVKTLQQKETGTKEKEEIPQQQQQEPEKPQVLGAEDQAEILKNPAASKGPEDAKVTIVEFSEYQCPFCKRYVDQAYVEIMKNYGEQIRYVFRDFPLQFHQHAQITAEAARCAGDQDQYWPYHDKLFSDQDKWLSQEDAKEVLVGFSGELGLDQGAFKECLTSGKFTQAVKDDLALGQKVGVQGTPSFFVNGQMLVGAQPYSAFEALIKQELEK